MSPVVSDRTWTFDSSAERVWATLSQTEQFGSWWPWLSRFDAPDGLVPGAEWRCAVRPPLPYTVRFTLTVEEVRAPITVAASVRGDLVGQADLALTPNGSTACTLRLRSALRPIRRPLVALGFVAGPLTRWGHDWVLDTGMRQFATHAALARP